ncbi:ParA family protein, partial [Asaia spathodeae]|uniref:ParA family protein n=1 Tax=Asaia spathodeae TaxID=657016 RepID=UPI002FC3C1A8
MQHDKPQTLAVIAQKGGTGKTTLTVNLATLAARDGLRVAIVDCDPQRSALSWWQTREAEDVALIEGNAADLPAIQTAAGRQGFDLLIVDTRPSVEAETSHAIQSATACIIPTRPGILDLRAVASTAQLVRSTQTPGCI